MSENTTDSAETFLFTTRRPPLDLVVALRMILTELVHVGWSQVWQESLRRGVLIEMPQAVRMAVFDLGAAGMATPEPTDPYSHTWTTEDGEYVHAGRLAITAEGRRLLELLEMPHPTNEGT